mgnify:CR=1 FL=1
MEVPPARLRHMRLVYVTPGHQFPLGVSMTLRRRLAQGGPALIAREFSIDAMVDGNLAVYREVLGS